MFRHRIVSIFTICLALVAPASSRGASPAAPPRTRLADRLGDPLPAEAQGRLGSVRLREGGAIVGLAFSPDGKILASAGDWVVRLWDPATGKERRCLRGFRGPVRAMSLAPNGKFVVACGGSPDETQPVRRWDVATGRALPWPVRPPGWINALAISPDSKTLAMAARGVIHLWDLARGTEIRTFKGLKGRQSAVLTLAFSPGGKWLLSGSKDGTICLWDVGKGELSRSVRTTVPVLALVFSPDGRTFASTGPEHTILLWSTRTGESIQRLEGHSSFVRALAFSPNGRMLLSGSYDQTVRLWDLASRKELRCMTGHTALLQAVAFAPDGRTVASGGRDQRIRLWDVATERERLRTEGHDGIVWTLAFSPDGKILASGAGDKAICLWDVATRTLLRKMQGDSIYVGALAFSPDGKTLASAGAGLHLWDVATGKQRWHIAGKPPGIAGMVFSPDGKFLACGRHDQSAQLYEATTGKRVRTLLEHPTIPYRLCFSADGETLVAAGNSFAIRAWSVRSGARLYQYSDRRGGDLYVALSDDGRNVAGGRDRAVLVWESATGQGRARLPQKQIVWAVTFSADGRQLVTSLHSGRLGVWDLATAREIAQLPGHSDIARSLTCSPDGRTLASGGSNGTILLWDLGRLPGPKRPTRPLTAKEVDEAWKTLNDGTGDHAYHALWTLQAHPQQILPLLDRHLRQASTKSAPAVNPKRIPKLLRDLDDEDVRVREKASAELENQDEDTEAALRKALATTPSLEVRVRIECLLNKGRATHPVGERLRALRMLELLEHLGTAEARVLLKTLAANKSDVWLAREAKAAETRLRRAHGPKP